MRADVDDLVCRSQPAFFHEPGRYKRLVEREVLRLGGIKSPYSHSCFTREEFASAYGIRHYECPRASDDGAGAAARSSG